MTISESGIEFDLPVSAIPKHDEINRIFPAVDFTIEEPTRWIWLEIKNWEPRSMPAKYRGGQRISFLVKMGSKTYFRDELRGKFLGTCSFLSLTGSLPTKAVLYVILQESPRLESAHKLHATDRIKGLLCSTAWSIGVDAAVIDLADWNARFPAYPAAITP